MDKIQENTRQPTQFIDAPAPKQNAWNRPNIPRASGDAQSARASGPSLTQTNFPPLRPTTAPSQPDVHQSGVHQQQQQQRPVHQSGVQSSNNQVSDLLGAMTKLKNINMTEVVRLINDFTKIFDNPNKQERFNGIIQFMQGYDNYDI